MKEKSFLKVMLSNTAVLGETASTTRVVGDGFQIERYVPATSRSFRYLSVLQWIRLQQNQPFMITGRKAQLRLLI